MIRFVLIALAFLAMGECRVHAQSPDGSFILPFNLNSSPQGIVTNAISTQYGFVTLAPAVGGSGDYEIYVNGNFTTGGFGKMAAVLNSGQLYGLQNDGGWVQFNGSAWSWAAVPAPVTPDQTMVTSGVLVSPVGIWGFARDAVTGGKEVLLNGMPAGVAATTLENLAGSVYAKNSSGAWFQNSGWVPTADPNSYPVPQTLTAAYLAANFAPSFSDTFPSPLSEICGNGTFSSTCKWYNGTEQCCMSPTSPDPATGLITGGAMYPTQVGPLGPVNPYSNDPAGGLDITIHALTTTGQPTNWITEFSGVMTTIAGDKQGFKQQYGYFEVTMKVSANPGTWPAFWMRSLDRAMEIDIAEVYTHDLGHYWATAHDYAHGILNGPTEFPSTTVDLSTGYHQYGLLWDAGHISFYFDRQLMASFATPPSAKQPMYPILDEGVGGGWPTSSATLNGDVLAVQSVNVWQHN